MAKRKVKRGRSRIAMGLGLFLLVATGVIWRRTIGVPVAEAMLNLREQKSRLEAERAKLATDIRSASSRSRLGPLAIQRLGLKVPSDSQVIDLPRPESAPSR
jgi:hypothetical protein